MKKRDDVADDEDDDAVRNSVSQDYSRRGKYYHRGKYNHCALRRRFQCVK